jgi:hypothetical protein
MGGKDGEAPTRGTTIHALPLSTGEKILTTDCDFHLHSSILMESIFANRSGIARKWKGGTHAARPGLNLYPSFL